MKKSMLAFLVLAMFIPCHAQQGRTFRIEKLTPPEGALKQIYAGGLWESRVLAETKFRDKGISQDSAGFYAGILATSLLPDSMANLNGIEFYNAETNSFFYSVYRAYADHRPLVISPDMIWLLISQGFARHVNENAEALRSRLVDFDGRMSLMVIGDPSLLTDPDGKSWQKVIGEFADKIGENTVPGLAGTLTADFSTTTPVERIASQITLMEGMKSFFEYITIRVVCGIPEITLTGTTKDWQRVLDKTLALAEYDLEWWVDELEPVLREFVAASRGRVDKKFWRAMFKHHEGFYGRSDGIDGWIVKFYPYDRFGNRLKFEQFELTVGSINIPPEYVRVDTKLLTIYPSGKTVETPIELWAGFIGADQNLKNYALTPRIGWMVRIKREGSGLDQKRLESLRKNNRPTPPDRRVPGGGSGINIRVKELPEEIYHLGTIYDLSVTFTGRIIIPDRLAESRIEKLTLNGAIDEAGIERIRAMFPETALTINMKRYQTE